VATVASHSVDAVPFTLQDPEPLVTGVSPRRTDQRGARKLRNTRDLWGSKSQPEPVTWGDRRPGMIVDVSLCLLYLIFNHLLSWLTLLTRSPAAPG
jgi:hypothetical protein